MFDDNILLDDSEMELVDRAAEEEEEAEDDLMYGIFDIRAEDMLIPDTVINLEEDNQS